MAFGNISTLYFPIAASAGASQWGTDVRKMLASADASVDGTSRAIFGTGGAAVTRTIDPYNDSSADSDQTLFGWAVTPTDMNSVSGARRFYPAGNHTLTARLSQGGVSATNVTMTLFIYRVGPSPTRTRTLLGSNSSVTSIAALSAVTTATVTVALPQVIFEADETLQYSVELNCTGVAITGRTGVFRTGTEGGVAIRVDTPVLGTLQDKNLTGGSTPAGAITNTASKVVGGGVTPANAGRTKIVLLRSTLGAVATAGNLSKIPSKFLTGSITSTVGTLVRTALKPLTGTIASAGQLTQRFVFKLLSGGITPTGALRKVPNIFKVGAVASSGGLRKEPMKVFGGTITSVGSIRRIPLKVLAGTIASVGAISNRFVTKLLGGTITPAGTPQKVPSVYKAGTVASTGSLRKVPLKFFTGVISTAGAIQRSLVKFFTGTVGSSGAMTYKEPAKTLSGNITPTGTERNVIAKFFRGFLYGPSGDGTGGSTTIIRRVLNIFDD
jgi:hypothetical protein